VSTCWVVAVNPERRNLVAEAADNHTIVWPRRGATSSMRVGDPVLFYNTGPSDGAYISGLVVAESDIADPSVSIQFRDRITPPICSTDIAGMAMARPAHGTAFAISGTDGGALIDLMSRRQQPLPIDADELFDTTLHNVETHLERHNVHVRQLLLEKLCQAPPAVFERAVKDLLRAKGFEDAEVTGRSNDGGIDVRARLTLSGLTSVPTVVQAKRWAKNVGAPEVRDLRGALQAGEQGVLITTASFTSAARDEAVARGKALIGLIDGDELARMMVENRLGVTAEVREVLRLDSHALLD
jgi:HJR/Mrr/RecB family endonuclease